MALDNLSPLEGIAAFELLPAIHGSYFDTDHLLVAVLRLEVTHALRLLDPWVPDDGVHEVVADDVQVWAAVLGDGRGILLDRLVDAIDFASDGHRWVCLLVFRGVEDFVDVGGAAEAVDCYFRDILYHISLIRPISRLLDGCLPGS